MRLNVFELRSLFFWRYSACTSLMLLGDLCGLRSDVDILDNHLDTIGGGSFQVMQSVSIGLLVSDHCFEDGRL